MLYVILNVYQSVSNGYFLGGTSSATVSGDYGSGDAPAASTDPRS